MKKVLILFVLFALPVIVYILFASAAHNFAHLKVLTKEVPELENFQALRGDSLYFKNYNTVLCFFGKDIDQMKGNAFNLHERIYKKNAKYKDFQIIVIAKRGTQQKAQQLLDQLHNFNGENISKWKFAFGNLKDIQQLFDGLKTDVSLDQNKSTPYVFLVDREQQLRGSREEEDADRETLYGYDTRSIAALNNTLVDDVKVLLAEYRLKLKKYERDVTKKQE